MSHIHSAPQNISKNNRDISDEILRAIEELKLGSGFGSIEIVLHEGRVTQIEKREKLRFNYNSNQDHFKNTPSAKAVDK